MNDKELWELMSIICEGQDSEQRRKVEQYITDLKKRNERQTNMLQKIFNIVYSDDTYEKQVKQVRDVLLDIERDL